MKRLLAVTGLALLVLVPLVLLLRRNTAHGRASLELEARTAFLGFTNIPLRGNYAMFTFSNFTQADVAASAIAFEQSTPEGWTRTQLVGKTARWMGRWIGFQDMLSPNDGCVFFVPPPVTNASWRIVLRCQERAAVVDFANDLVRHARDTNSAAHQDKVFSGRTYFVITPGVPGI